MIKDTKDLTVSQVDRQNILNNPYAVKEIEKALGLNGVKFEGKFIVFKDQVADFFGVTPRTIDNYITNNEEELTLNGYEVINGNRLNLLKKEILSTEANETYFVNIKMVSKLGIFDIRSFLNLAMLLSESEKAKVLRRVILEIVIDVINQKTGGGTKYINQRDDDFIHSWFSEENYRKQFTDALRDYVDLGNFKYPYYTDQIYVSIFKEKAKEYRAILKLSKSDKTRDTFYSEVLDIISSFECGLAEELKIKFELLGRKLIHREVDEIFNSFKSKAHWKPLVEKARNKMASRDLAFRDALHLHLTDYITPLEREDFERFIGEKSKDLQKRLEDTKDVMKRLKDR